MAMHIRSAIPIMLLQLFFCWHLLVLFADGAVPVAVDSDTINQVLTFGHTNANLLHLMEPHANDTKARLAGTSDSHIPARQRIHYSHNITHPDGSQDIVHYNVSHRYGVISLDFIPEVTKAVCDDLTVTVHMSDVSTAETWTIGSPLVGSSKWGCVDIPVGKNEIDDARVMPFYREIKSLHVDPVLGVARIVTKNISLLQLFAGKVHMSHTPAPASEDDVGDGAVDTAAYEVMRSRAEIDVDEEEARSAGPMSSGTRRMQHTLHNYGEGHPNTACSRMTGTAADVESFGGGNSLDECAARCDGNSRCNSFLYFEHGYGSEHPEVPDGYCETWTLTSNCGGDDWVQFGGSVTYFKDEGGASISTTSDGLTLTDRCEDFSGSPPDRTHGVGEGFCPVCLAHSERGTVYGDNPCSYCTTTGVCTASTTFAMCHQIGTSYHGRAVYGKWIGPCSTCHSPSCIFDVSRCPYTDDGEVSLHVNVRDNLLLTLSNVDCSATSAAVVTVVAHRAQTKMSKCTLSRFNGMGMQRDRGEQEQNGMAGIQCFYA